MPWRWVGSEGKTPSVFEGDTGEFCHSIYQTTSMITRKSKLTLTCHFLQHLTLDDMSTEMNPDAFNMDIPILTRSRPVRNTYDRDAHNMDIPILFRRLFNLKLSTANAKESRGPYPSTPLYWSETMERESTLEKRRATLEDEWVIITERGKFVGRVDMDEMTA